MLKELTQVADFKLPGRLFQVLGPTLDKLWIHSFDLQKGNFNFLLEEGLIITLLTGQKSLPK